MEKNGEKAKASASSTTISGSRLSSIKKFLKLNFRQTLTCCTYEEFCERLPDYSPAQHEHLYRLYTRIISDLPENIEEEFDTMCVDTEAGATFDYVEEVLEEQSLDPLHNNPSNIKEVAQSLAKAKRNDIHNLTKMLEMAEQRKRNLSARLEREKSKSQEFSGAEGIIEKLRKGTVDYGAAHTLQPPYP